MKVLFVHNNFPAQFRHLAAALARRPGTEVAAVGAAQAKALPQVRLIRYAMPERDVSPAHPFARRFDLECHRAEQVMYALTTLARSGFTPDVVIAHPGWGEALPVRTIFPRARVLIYCEFFYGAEGRDVGFDPEFPMIGADGAVGLQAKNAATLLAMAEADGGIAPTEWQRSTFPARLREQIAVLHEGIDTDAIRPDPRAQLRLPDGRVLTARDEVVTFVARNLEPLRGYHMFMRALPAIMAARPNAQVVVIGGHGTSYGAPPPAGQNWASLFRDEVAGRIDPRRLHLLGHLPHADYLAALQISGAHVYLTYPFVLSWSLLEAMSAGCLVIGSDTAPVREVLDEETGHLVPFFEPARLADTVIGALADPAAQQARRRRARAAMQARFDLRTVCLPRLLAMVAGETPAPARPASMMSQPLPAAV